MDRNTDWFQQAMDTIEIIDESDGGNINTFWTFRAILEASLAQALAAERQAAALEKIASILEMVTNNEMLSVAFWEQV